MLTIACVWTGEKYGVECVSRLRAMVERHLDRPFDFICLTDRDEEIPGVTRVDIGNLVLGGWWGKMALFDPAIRGDERTLYFDLDTVIIGSLEPLADWDGDFGICRNFTRAYYNFTDKGFSHCRYGSCVMSFAPGWGGHVWDAFKAQQTRLVAAPYGDQQVVEYLVPDAAYLQDVLPDGFFLNYRNLIEHTAAPPAGAAIVTYGGRFNPGNCGPEWSRKAWTGS